jgi:hypothetical protein
MPQKNIKKNWLFVQVLHLNKEAENVLILLCEHNRNIHSGWHGKSNCH